MSLEFSNYYEVNFPSQLPALNAENYPSCMGARDDECPLKAKKRARIAQVDVLQRAFETKIEANAAPYLSPGEAERLAWTTSLTESQVKKWFSNKRCAVKKREKRD